MSCPNIFVIQTSHCALYTGPSPPILRNEGSLLEQQPKLTRRAAPRQRVLTWSASGGRGLRLGACPRKPRAVVEWPYLKKLGRLRQRWRQTLRKLSGTCVCVSRGFYLEHMLSMQHVISSAHMRTEQHNYAYRRRDVRKERTVSNKTIQRAYQCRTGYNTAVATRLG